MAGALREGRPLEVAIDGDPLQLLAALRREARPPDWVLTDDMLGQTLSGLQLAQLLGVLPRQSIGNGSKDLRGLHQRPLQAAERGLQLNRMTAAVDLAPKDARARELRRQHTYFTSYLSVTAQAPAKTGALVVKDLLVFWIFHGPQIGSRPSQIQICSATQLFQLIDHALNH